VFDLRARRLLRRSAAPTRGSRIESVVLTSSGTAAYTVQIRDSQVDQVWQVRSLDASGEHVLDAGPNVAPGSLARDRRHLAEGHLTWQGARHYEPRRCRSVIPAFAVPASVLLHIHVIAQLVRRRTPAILAPWQGSEPSSPRSRRRSTMT